MLDSTNLPEVDINAIATDLNNKMDRDGLNSLASVCVETYQNGTSWYRVYSDGWCEQGGLFTSTSAEQFHQVNLLKEMNNTNYLVFLQRFRDYYDEAASYPVVRTKSTTFFTCFGFTESTMWTVSGYIS